MHEQPITSTEPTPTQQWFGRVRASAMRGFHELGEHRAPVLLFLMAVAIAFVIAILPADTAAPVAHPESSVGINTAAFEVLPGQASDAPVLGETAEPADDARARNGAVPFVSGAIPAAAPFKLAGSALDLERATRCLALAAMAEAGQSDVGQRAVIQVVLNRVRHPAFARTVCGVVFQGSERRTGCQFTFTCDGSLARNYNETAWEAARGRAAQALAGYVFAAVGTATHYHTDWVFPYWSPKLEKLARIETHLFFRWPGYWGSKAALRMGYRGGEPAYGSAPVTPVPAVSGMPGAAPSVESSAPPISGAELVMRDPTGKANFVLLGSGSADEALALARKLCTDPGTCRVSGWSDRAAIPARFPVPPEARASLQFSYSRDPGGAEIALYNCDTYKGLPREKCIPKGAIPR
jgi:spore germination cell wall hydrolase CwlJ-like protein